ncbi:MAG: helix-turn-helix domain-containing protein [Actinomycetota bacterium]
MSTDEPLAVSPARAAELLGVSRQHIYNLIERGQLPRVKLGRATRIRRADLELLLEEGSA